MLVACQTHETGPVDDRSDIDDVFIDDDITPPPIPGEEVSDVFEEPEGMAPPSIPGP